MTWINEPTPVKVPGVDITFPSIGACARHFGLSRSTVRGALERGSLNTLGSGKNTLKMKPIWVQALDGSWARYPSHADYARAYGRRPEAVSKFLRRMYKNPGKSVYHPFTGVVVRVSEPEGGL